MRISYSIKNSISSIASNIIIMLLGFIAQTVFIKLLGSEYLGLNSLFLNIISMLSITELGISSAIIYNLYKPLNDDNKEDIKSLMLFYKKCYFVIAFIILVIGLIILPFLNIIVGTNNIEENIKIIFMLFISDSIFTYLFSYKRSLLIADQKNYVINITHIICLIILNIIQISILFIFKNYYIYLIISILFKVIENISISLIVNHKYPYLNEPTNKLNKNYLDDIIKKVKALFFHKIGSFIVMGTDNILISYFFGLTTVGLYANYNLIISSINKIFSQLFTSNTSSIGNLLITDDETKKYDIYKKIRFINFWFSIFTSVSLFIIMEPFVNIWLGKEYLLSKIVLLSLVVNYYFQTMRYHNSVFKDAAGIFYEDRFVPILESIINIIASIIFAKLFGLVGIFIGTICSNLLLHLYSYPKYVYKKIFNKNRKYYYIDNLKYLVIFIVILLISYMLSIISLNIIYRVLISIIIPNIILYILYRKTDSFNYFKNLFLNLTRRKKDI